MPETEPGQEKVSAPADLLWQLSEQTYSQSRQQSPPHPHLLPGLVCLWDLEVEEVGSASQLDLSPDVMNLCRVRPHQEGRGKKHLQLKFDSENNLHL